MWVSAGPPGVNIGVLVPTIGTAMPVMRSECNWCSARSYVAAGLATAIAGAAVASPALAQKAVQLPSVSSAGVELSAFVSDAEREAERVMSDAE